MSKNVKKFGLVLLVLAISMLAAVAVSAQDEDAPGDGPRDRFRLGDREVIQVIVEQTGLTVEEIFAEVRDGKTLAEVITENGGDVEAIVSAAVETMTEIVNEAVASGVITQERADDILAGLEDRIRAALNGEGRLIGPPDREDRGDRPHPVRGILAAAAEATGLELDALMAQLREGATLGEILSANGADVEAFIDGLLADAQARFAEAVEAGRVTQQQADERLDDMRGRIEDLLNRTLPERGERPDRPNRPDRPGGPGGNGNGGNGNGEGAPGA